MKITEAQLRRIVRQEVMREGGIPPYDENDPYARDYGIAAWERSQSYAAYDAQLKKAKTQAEVERIADEAAKGMEAAVIQGFDPDDPRFSDPAYIGQGRRGRR